MSGTGGRLPSILRVLHGDRFVIQRDGCQWARMAVVGRDEMEQEVVQSIRLICLQQGNGHELMPGAVGIGRYYSCCSARRMRKLFSFGEHRLRGSRNFVTTPQPNLKTRIRFSYVVETTAGAEDLGNGRRQRPCCKAFGTVSNPVLMQRQFDDVVHLAGLIVG